MVSLKVEVQAIMASYSLLYTCIRALIVLPYACRKQLSYGMSYLVSMTCALLLKAVKSNNWICDTLFRAALPHDCMYVEHSCLVYVFVP